MICKPCKAKMKCFDTRPFENVTMRRWHCVTCGTKIKTIEHVYDECAAKTNSFDRIESRLAVIARSASEAIELIEKLKGKEND